VKSFFCSRNSLLSPRLRPCQLVSDLRGWLQIRGAFMEARGHPSLRGFQPVVPTAASSGMEQADPCSPPSPRNSLLSPRLRPCRLVSDLRGRLQILGVVFWLLFLTLEHFGSTMPRFRALTGTGSVAGHGKSFPKAEKLWKTGLRRGAGWAAGVCSLRARGCCRGCHGYPA